MKGKKVGADIFQWGLQVKATKTELDDGRGA